MTPRAGAVEAGRRDEGRVWLALPGHASTVPSTASDCEQSGRGAPRARVSPGANSGGEAVVAMAVALSVNLHL
jgi:hypothetical protein